MKINIQIDTNNAIKKALADDKVKSLIADDNKFLSSAFTTIDTNINSIDSWIINLFDKETKNITSIHVSYDTIDIKEPSPVANLSEIESIDIDKILITCEKAIELAIAENEKVNGKIQNSKIFITLHNNQDHTRECWTISLLGLNLNAHIIKIDAYDGKILSSNVKNLMDGSKVINTKK
ncbi:MAG: hypothetical protein K0B02_03205 [DPANN group archaeon]|nr:hypothetical protein [DPANN group archaeon]